MTMSYSNDDTGDVRDNNGVSDVTEGKDSDKRDSLYIYITC